MRAVSQGGLHLSRPIASAVIAVFIVACLLIFLSGPADIRQGP